MAEYSDADVRRIARAARVALGWNDAEDSVNAATRDEVRKVLVGGESCMPAWDRAVLAERARIDAERTPAPSVEDVMAAVKADRHDDSPFRADEIKLRAFLSALPDEARRVGMAAVKGGK